MSSLQSHAYFHAQFARIELQVATLPIEFADGRSGGRSPRTLDQGLQHDQDDQDEQGLEHSECTEWKLD